MEFFADEIEIRGGGNCWINLVPGERLELSRYHYRWILNPAGISAAQ